MTRRMTLIVLALVGLMVLVVTVSPPQPSVQDPAPPAPTTTAQLSDPNAFDVTATIDAGASKPVTVDAELGDRVELTVESATLDSVALGDLQMRTADKGEPARFELLADTPGDYPVMLVNANRRVGTLAIR
ncbi:MAG TPA: hypothetical protein VNS09_15355 [Solirubrobacter sp.]|nr:hypothetical protein [Solirubrobacter sp.]